MGGEINCVSCNWTVEDQKDLLSAVSPELRQKEVQMNFFNQLTSVFNPDLSTISGSPSAAHMQASVGGLLPHYWHLPSSGVLLLSFMCLIQMNVFPKSLCFMVQCLYWSLQSIVNPRVNALLLLFTGWEWLWWPDHRSGHPGQDEKCLCFSECVKLTGTWWAFLTVAVSSVMGSQTCCLVAPSLQPH